MTFKLQKIKLNCFKKLELSILKLTLVGRLKILKRWKNVVEGTRQINPVTSGEGGELLKKWDRWSIFNKPAFKF